MPAVAVWLRAFRIYFVIPSILPAILGSVIAWAQGHPLQLFHFILVVGGVTVNHLGLNLVDDVLDYRHAVDLKKGDEKNFFTGGSGVLPEGLLKERDMLKGATCFFSITFLTGLYLTYQCGWPVLALGIFGMASSIFYTMPPVSYGYRGFGELGLLINFGPVITLGAYYVQAGTFAAEPFVASLVPGFMMWSMILINEIPDFEADTNAGKWNLVARFGRHAGAVLYGVGLGIAYGILIWAAATATLSPLVLMGLVSLPFAFKSFVVLKQHLNDPLAMTPANLAMIKVHFLTVTFMVIAYIIEVIRI